MRVLIKPVSLALNIRAVQKILYIVALINSACGVCENNKNSSAGTHIFTFSMIFSESVFSARNSTSVK